MKRFLVLFAGVLSCILILQGCSASKGRGDYYENYAPAAGDESYSYDGIKENDFSLASEKNTSTFSLDRNTTSYSIARRQITDGAIPAADSVRIEEYVNYFSYDYDEPTDGKPLSISGSLSDCPWNSEHKLFTVGVAAKKIDFSQKKQNNLVFLIDVSGSMFGSDRLGLIQQSFAMLSENLDDDDYVSIVTYASGTKVVAEGLRGSQKTEICAILEDLEAGGSTAGASGIQLAYKTASKYFIQDGNNRVLLATDGDFNVGISNKNELKSFISQKRDSGIYLSVLGVGMYNTRDDLMETLARNGNGNYGYLDSITEARKMLVTEMGGTLETVAKDAKIQVTFNPETVEKYRLIGYENKMISDADFDDENKDAGEIGSGHTVTAVYEIELKEGADGGFASAVIRCKDPETDESIEINGEFATDMYTQSPSEDVVFIGCVTEFGLLLRESEYKGNASWESVIARLRVLPSVSGDGGSGDEFRMEFLTVVRKAASLYGSRNQ